MIGAALWRRLTWSSVSGRLESDEDSMVLLPLHVAAGAPSLHVHKTCQLTEKESSSRAAPNIWPFQCLTCSDTCLELNNEEEWVTVQWWWSIFANGDQPVNYYFIEPVMCRFVFGVRFHEIVAEGTVDLCIMQCKREDSGTYGLLQTRLPV